MNKMKSLFLIAATLFLYACGGNNQKTEKKVLGTNPELTSACGELLEFSVNSDTCEKYGLPEVQFSTRYGKNLFTDPPQVGYQNYHYNYFLKWDDKEIQTEAISLGYSTLQRNAFMKETLAAQLLQQIRSMYVQIGFDLDDVTMGSDEFDGKEYFMYRAKGTIHDKELEFDGDYLIQCLLVEPDVDNENGLLVMMLANQDSPIKDFDDFADKSCISQIWQNLEFEY